MSVLDRAIVKAFERRSRSTPTETSSVEVVPPAAPVLSSEISESIDERSAVATHTSPTPSAEIDHTPSEPTDTASLSVPEGIQENVPAENNATLAESTNDQELRSLDETSVLFRRDDESPAEPDNKAPDPVSSFDPNVQNTIVPTPVVEPGVTETRDVPESSTQTWHWPAICEQLDQFTGEGFRELAKHLQYAAEQGHKVLAFASSQRESGRTSVLLTLSRILALEGKSRVLLIDADPRHPNIAALAKVTPQVGLEQVLQRSARLSDAVIPMTPGQVTLLPLLAPVSEVEWRRNAPQLKNLLPLAKSDYDIILIDAGVFGPETKLPECWLRGVADAVVTVARQIGPHRTDHRTLDWKQIGIDSLGVIETFA